MAKEESDMYATKPCSESHLARIGRGVKQQLLASDLITSKIIELGIKDAEAIELLDVSINEWIESVIKNSQEYKGLTGWILFDSMKKRFLDI